MRLRWPTSIVNKSMITWWTSLWNWRIANLSTKRRSTLPIISCRSLDASFWFNAVSVETLKLNAAVRFTPVLTSSLSLKCQQKWTTSTTLLTLQKFWKNSASKERWKLLMSTCMELYRHQGQMPSMMQLPMVTDLPQTEKVKVRVKEVQYASKMEAMTVLIRMIVHLSRTRMEMNLKRIYEHMNNFVMRLPSWKILSYRS